MYLATARLQVYTDCRSPDATYKSLGRCVILATQSPPSSQHGSFCHSRVYCLDCISESCIGSFANLHCLSAAKIWKRLATTRLSNGNYFRFEHGFSRKIPECSGCSPFLVSVDLQDSNRKPLTGTNQTRWRPGVHPNWRRWIPWISQCNTSRSSHSSCRSWYLLLH